MAEVKFLGKLREITGVIKKEVVSPQVRHTLVSLSEEYGPELADLLFTDGVDGELNKDIEVLVNGRNIRFLDRLDTSLEDEDKITILYHGVRGFPGG